MGPSEREAMYGTWTSGISFTDTLESADIAVLPYTWNYYIETKRVAEALTFADTCRALHKKLITQIGGDFGVTPPVTDCYVLRQSGYATGKLPLQYTMPVFIRDPLKEVFHTNTVLLHPKPQKPLVGFCGQAGGGLVKYTKDALTTLGRNSLYHLGISPGEPQQILPASLLRNRVLNILEKDTRIDCQFIRRRKYRAGARTEAERSASALEFFSNIQNTDYTVCVRGSGNFSVRLFETLSMGRIPVFVNTDCLLPFEELIPWKEHCVWVNGNELNRIGEAIHLFHNRLDAQAFENRLTGNRLLWEKHLSISGFWDTFLNKIIGAHTNG